MKLYRFLPLTFFFLLMVSGCRKDKNKPDPDPDPDPVYTHYALFHEQVDGLGDRIWQEGDFIRIFPAANPSSPRILRISEEERGRSMARVNDVTFSGYGDPCYALFPDVPDLLPEGTLLTLTLPREQPFRADGPDKAVFPALAVGDGTGNDVSGTDGVALRFRNLFSLVRVRVTASRSISRLLLRSRSDETLWGEYRVDLSWDGFPVAVFAENPSPERNTLTIQLKQEKENDRPGTGEVFVSGGSTTVVGGEFDGNLPGTPLTAWFVVPPGTLAEGFDLLVYDDASGCTRVECPGGGVARSALRAEDNCTAEADLESLAARTDVPNKAFYKDIFMDSGVSVTSNTSMPVVGRMNLELEYFRADSNSEATRSAQAAVYVGNAEDLNGRLLYPDGEPRYRLLYVNGGSSATHGYSLETEGRDRFRQFVARGGTYIGSCAGAYLATQGYLLDEQVSPDYLGLWPSHCNRLATENFYLAHTVPEESPLLRYCDFGGDFFIDSVRHHNGPCFRDWELVPGTEVLTCLYVPDSIHMHTYPAIIAYKPDAFQGRIIPCGSHPEQVKYGENLDLMEAMVRYAFDGQGMARAKGTLRNGELRRMDRTTPENKPEYTRIGDLQCHHFLFSLPERARNVRIRMEALADYRLDLMLAHGTFAFKEDALHALENGDRVKEMVFDTLEKGIWYVGVQCMSTVTVTKEHGTNGTVYGNTAVLNGVPYTVRVSWEL